VATAPRGDLSQWGADRRKAGDAGDGGRERRRRRLAGVPDRCQWQSHRGERIDGRAESAPALLAAVAVVAILLFLTGPVAHLPKALLGAVIVSAAVGLVDVGACRKLAAADRVEVAIAAVTAAGVVVVGVLEAVVFPVGLTILDAVRGARGPATRCSATTLPSVASSTSRSVRTLASCPAWSCTGSTTGCSSPMPARS
jgi:Sulfate permease family